jgi:hypothetical protein
VSLTTAELPQLHQDEGGWWCSDPHGYAWTDRHPTAGAAWDAWVELVASLPVQSLTDAMVRERLAEAARRFHEAKAAA